jgi:hypothetical protein
MTKCLKFTGLILWIVLSIAIAACSSNGGNEPTNIDVETDSQNITSLGKFPVGIRDYKPPKIEITSPVSANPLTTIIDSENSYLREIVKGEKWALDVKGTVTPSTFGTAKSPLEFKGVYVNWDLVDAADGDDIKWVDGKFTFTKTVFITKEDLANTFYPIMVTAVDEKDFIAGARSVFILQDRASNKFGAALGNALHLSGNKEFTSNALSILISQLNGFNFAPNMGTVNLLGVNLLVPRTVMLQGIELIDFSVSSGEAGLSSVNLSIKVSNLVVEYTNKLSLFKKGQNVTNINMKNVEIDGLIIEFRNENGVTSAYLKAGDMAFVKGAGFKYNLDSPFTGILNYLLDNVFSFLIQDVFDQKTMKPVQLKIGYNALNLLLRQLSGKDISSTPVTGLNYCSEENGGIKLGMDMTLPEVKREGLDGFLKSTYASSQVKSDKIELSLNYGNSSIALSDDYINQLLAMNFVSAPGKPQEIASLDLNEIIQEMNINIGSFKLWPWLRNGNGELPDVRIKFLMPTPPVLKIQGNGNYVGTFYVRNVLVEVHELNESDNEVELLARLSIDMDISIKWENGKFVLECGKGDSSQFLIFNKLYPLFLPPQLKDIHNIIASSLNQFLSKLELIGYPIKNVSAVDNAYLVFSGELGSEIKSNGTIDTNYSNLWIRKSLTSKQGADSRMINGKTATSSSTDPGILQSLFFKSIDGSNNVIQDMDWNDSCGYFYDLNQSNCLVTGISFNKDFIFSYITGNTVEFYEEFAVMCVAYGNAVKSTDEFIPAEGCAIPFEFSVEDIPDTIKVPLSSNIGIGIRVKKDPTIPLKVRPVAVKTASASNIKIEYVDLSLNLGLSF